MVLFLKVDVDKCDAVAKRYGIKSLPTVKFFRGGSELQHCVATIEGGGPKFLAEYTQVMTKNTTAGDVKAMKPTWTKADMENLGTSEEDMKTLATSPLAKLQSFVSFLSREQQGLPQVDSLLPFDIADHDNARTAVAKSMLSRMKNDVVAWADTANKGKVPKINNLHDNDLAAFFEGAKGAEENLRSGKEKAEQLLKGLRELRDSDAAMIQDIIPVVTKAANWYVALSSFVLLFLFPFFPFEILLFTTQTSNTWFLFIFQRCVFLN